METFTQLMRGTRSIIMSWQWDLIGVKVREWATTGILRFTLTGDEPQGRKTCISVELQQALPEYHCEQLPDARGAGALLLKNGQN